MLAVTRSFSKEFSNLKSIGIGSQKLLKYKLCTTSNQCQNVRFVHYKNDQRKYGQPTPITHPHLLMEGEVNVGIIKEEFVQRRKNLVDKILSSNRINGRGLIILPSARKKYMVDHIPHFFRQDTDFRYLTGCLQPQSLLVIDFTETSHQTYLLLNDNTAYEEKWEGPRFGFQEATEFFGMDEVLSVHSFQEVLTKLTKDKIKLNLWYDFLNPRDEEIHQDILEFIKSLGQAHNLNNIHPLRDVLHELRSVKSSAEISLMRKTCEIGALGLMKTISSSKHLSSELDYLATIDYYSRLAGASYLAYPPVVASGNNANTIHYIAATDTVRPGDMMLMDSGCEYHGYSSDITRTWPVSGQFTQAQEVLYDIVLECQQTLIKSIVPNETTIDDLYRRMLRELCKSLQHAGIIKEQEESAALRFVHLYCPHNVGHHLGMDVHDCATLNKNTPLVPGNVITVEPGLYIRQDNDKVPLEFRGQGLRIEDDILITKSNCEILTEGCPKSKKEIQNLVKRGV
jgi:Xaa-Pro aminopeptidase